MSRELSEAPAASVIDVHSIPMVTSLDRAVEFITVYTLVLICQLIFVLTILGEKSLRRNNAYLFALAIVMTMLAVILLDFSELIGLYTGESTWTNVNWICEVFSVLEPGMENLCGVFLVFGVMERIQRYRLGHPAQAAYPRSDILGRLAGCVIFTIILQVIAVYALGDGMLTYSVGEVQVCEAQRSDIFVIAELVGKAVVMIVLLVLGGMLAYQKYNYDLEQIDLDLAEAGGTRAMLVVTLTWFLLSLPLLVAETVTSLLAGLEKGATWLTTAQLAYRAMFGLIPLFWVVLDPVLAGTIRTFLCFCFCCEGEGVMEPPLFTPSGD